MIRRLTCTTLAWWLLASSAAAQSRDVRPVVLDPPRTPVPTQGVGPIAPVPPPDTEPMAHPDDGREGVWFSLPAARDALAALATEDAYLEQLALLNRRLALRTTEASELRLALRATERSRDELRAVVRTAEARRVAAERDRDRWYRVPALWLGVGAGLGAALAVLLAFAIGGST